MNKDQLQRGNEIQEEIQSLNAQVKYLEENIRRRNSDRVCSIISLKFSVKFIYLFIPFLLIGSFVYGNNVLLMRNFFFLGVPYFFIGNFIRLKFENEQLNLITYYTFVGIVLSYMLSLAEQFYWQGQDLDNFREHYVGTTFFVSLVFLLLVMRPLFMKNIGLNQIVVYTL